MPFLFTRNKTKNTREGLCIRTVPRINDIISSATSRNKLRRHSERRGTSPTSLTSEASMSRNLGSSVSGYPHIGMGIADIVLDPHQYTALLLQAASAPDVQGRPSSNQATERSLTLSPSADSEVEAPPSTPLPQPSSSISAEGLLRDGPVDAIVEGVTYDAILASTVKKTLDMSEDGRLLQLPETRAPPNSPVGRVRHRKFGSLVGVSMAIMESRI